MPWNIGARIPNPDPNPPYPETTMLRNPGAQPSAVVGLRWTSDSGRDDVYFVANSINNGVWGYNNLNWIGGTYYHKFNDYWHIAFETWNIHEFRVPNLDNPVAAAAIAAGGTPFSPQIIPFNAPNAAHCGNATALTCTADQSQFHLGYACDCYAHNNQRDYLHHRKQLAHQRPSQRSVEAVVYASQTASVPRRNSCETERSTGQS
jgi:hypothetical protein